MQAFDFDLFYYVPIISQWTDIVYGMLCSELSFSGENTKDEIELRREINEENGSCSSKIRGMESSGPATTR